MFTEMMMSGSGGGTPTLANIDVDSSGKNATFSWDFDADYLFVWFWFGANQQLTVIDCNTGVYRYGYGTTYARIATDSRINVTKRSLSVTNFPVMDASKSVALPFVGTLADF